jgi:hypothetical protein
VLQLCDDPYLKLQARSRDVDLVLYMAGTRLRLRVQVKWKFSAAVSFHIWPCKRFVFLSHQDFNKVSSFRI